MREIEYPQKREAAETFFGECYFATPAGLVRPDEIPEGWGLLEATAKGLRRKKTARQRRVDPLSPLVLSVLRRAATAMEEASLMRAEQHGEGLCVPISEVRVWQEAAWAKDERARKAQMRALDAYAPLSRLAYLAGERGIDEWTPGLVDELIERAVSAKLRRLMGTVKNAAKALSELIERSEA